MDFDEALKAAGQNGDIYRRFMAEDPHWKGHRIQAEWLASTWDAESYCIICRAEHTEIWQDGADRHDFADSSLMDMICIKDARKYYDWEVDEGDVIDLEDWYPPESALHALAEAADDE